MLKTTPAWLAKNLPLDLAKNAKVDSGTSSITRSARNLSVSVNMAEDAEVGEDNRSDNKMVKRSPFSKK